MSAGSIVLVHGTGVRLPGYEKTFDIAAATAADCGITRKLVRCAWGDPLGVEFKGLSLPDPPSADEMAKQEADFASWAWLLDDPLFELGMLTIRDDRTKGTGMANPQDDDAWEKSLAKVTAYSPGQEFRLLLSRADLEDLWEPARQRIVSDPITAKAFEASAHEPWEASRAVGRALVAQLHLEALSRSRPGPSATMRNKMLERLLADWEEQVFGIDTVFFNLVKRAGTRYLRGRRNAFNTAAALPLGDVLLYQTVGADIRLFIKTKIARSPKPVTVVAHSLGGIASVDLLALEEIPGVDGLVTLGSQSSFMHEIGALFSLKPGGQLRRDFPRWLNVFDRNDFLSFFASRVFPRATDFEVSSGQPFPESHSAYFGNEEVWTRIGGFIGEAR